MDNTLLAHMDPHTAKDGTKSFRVTANDDTGNMAATFSCINEHDAIMLRNAIRGYAQRLVHVHDYRDRKVDLKEYIDATLSTVEIAAALKGQ